MRMAKRSFSLSRWERAGVRGNPVLSPSGDALFPVDAIQQIAVRLVELPAEGHDRKLWLGQDLDARNPVQLSGSAVFRNSTWIQDFSEDDGA